MLLLPLLPLFICSLPSLVYAIVIVVRVPSKAVFFGVAAVAVDSAIVFVVLAVREELPDFLHVLLRGVTHRTCTLQRLHLVQLTRNQSRELLAQRSSAVQSLPSPCGLAKTHKSP